MNHLNIRIFGSVQGVSFRFYAQKEAEKLNLKGFVRNESNGSVYIEVEGEEKGLEVFVKWCHDGSESAEVERVDTQTGDLKNYQDFSIL